MNERSERASGAVWHLDAVTLREYAEGRAAPPAAWSVETHLTGCGQCREVLAHLLAEADRALLVEARAALTLPAGPAPARRPLAAVAEGVYGPWWAWASLVATGVAVLLLADRLTVPAAASRVGLTWGLALSPLVPVSLVAAVYALADRDEAARATSRGGLELVLLRTAAVLAVTVPLVAAALLLGERSTAAVSWLLPGLGLCATALVAGSWLGVERAAAAVAGLWALVVAVSMAPGSALVRHTAALIRPDGGGAALWSVVLLLTLAVLVVRRGGFDTPGRVSR